MYIILVFLMYFSGGPQEAPQEALVDPDGGEGFKRGSPQEALKDPHGVPQEKMPSRGSYFLQPAACNLGFKHVLNF